MTLRALWLAIGLALYVLPLVTVKPASGQQATMRCSRAAIELAPLPDRVDVYIAGSAVAMMNALLVAAEARMDPRPTPTTLFVVRDGDDVLIIMVEGGRACPWPVQPRHVYERARRSALGVAG